VPDITCCAWEERAGPYHMTGPRPSHGRRQTMVRIAAHAASSPRGVLVLTGAGRGATADGTTP